MVDKVKPLKIEDATNGTDIDMAPVEANPAEDYVTAKGYSFENSDDFLIDINTNELQFQDLITGTKTLSELLDAEEENFDPTGTSLLSVKTGPAIRELANNVSQSASPGFSWGRSGNVSTNTWLNNEGVPSNKAGRTVTFSSPSITRIFSASEDLDTYTLSIYEHEGDEVNLTLLTTLSVVASRSGDSGAISVSMTQNRQLAIRLTSGTAKNVVVGATLSGENT